MKIVWEKRKKISGSSVTEWVMFVNGVPKLYMRKFVDGRCSYSSYQVFDLGKKNHLGTSECVARFWDDRSGWKDAQKESLARGGINMRGGIKEAKEFGAKYFQ